MFMHPRDPDVKAYLKAQYPDAFRALEEAERKARAQMTEDEREFVDKLVDELNR